MNILLISASILLVILLIQYFFGSKRSCVLTILVIFGILFSLTILGSYHLFNKGFGASTPVNIQTENLTDKNLKIYAIAFWNYSGGETKSHVTFDTELLPSKKSSFQIDNHGTKEFWVVAKNQNNEIEYLNTITSSENQITIKLKEKENIEQNKAKKAKDLTNEKDKKYQIEKYAIWANIILIGLLIGSLVVRKNWWQHRL